MTEYLPLVAHLHLSPLALCGLVLLGAGVGYASGLFGVGGGFLITPLLIIAFHLSERVAVGTSMAQMIAVGITAARRHAAAGYVDARMGGYMAPSILFGTLLGKWALDGLSGLGSVILRYHPVPLVTLAINGAFLLLLGGIVIYLWRTAAAPAPAADAPSGPLCWAHGPLPVALPACGIARCSLVSLICCGLLLGVLAGLLGIGGGVLLVPLLLAGFALPLRQAIGTASLLILVSAVFATIVHAYAGNVDMRAVLALLAGSAAGVPLGAWHSHRLPVARLQRAFALLVCAVALVLAIRLASYFLP